MNKYRHKPTFIKAIRNTKDNRVTILQFLIANARSFKYEKGEAAYLITTDIGPYNKVLMEGEWVVQYPDGTIEILRAAQFKQYYEEEPISE